MFRTTNIFILLFFSLDLFGQSGKDREAIKNFCGCFEVEFRYMETFVSDKDQEASAPYKTRAVELVFLEEDKSDKLVLQHILVINDSFFIKHWRQDWEYKPKTLFSYLGNDSWESFKTNSSDVKNQWSQRVFGVDDAPRYAGVDSWVTANGKKTWMNTSDAPLPRREYSKRSDYDILRRTNKLIIEDWGWIHEQDNEKIATTTDGEEVLVEEKGRNIYRKTDDEYCEKARLWWMDRRGNWEDVRADWDVYMEYPITFEVPKESQDEYMSERLEAVFGQKLNPDDQKESVHHVLDSFRKRLPVAHQ